jgi:hypothetical protein
MAPELLDRGRFLQNIFGIPNILFRRTQVVDTGDNLSCRPPSAPMGHFDSTRGDPQSERRNHIGPEGAPSENRGRFFHFVRNEVVLASAGADEGWQRYWPLMWPVTRSLWASTPGSHGGRLARSSNAQSLPLFLPQCIAMTGGGGNEATSTGAGGKAVQLLVGPNDLSALEAKQVHGLVLDGVKYVENRQERCGTSWAGHLILFSRFVARAFLGILAIHNLSPHTSGSSQPDS